MSSNQGNNFVEVARVDDIPAGSMKHIEVGGKEIVILNANGKFDALNDRCAHMNAPLSMGNLTDIVTSPFHGAKFEVNSGKKVEEPVLTPSQEMEPLPKTWQNFMEHAGQLMSHIKTYDQLAYETTIEGNSVCNRQASSGITISKPYHNTSAVH
ncbi:MAG TPA: Rieske 2Fe-2S domain-containing protein [Nitrososphaeraceae archaeon]|jgi:nitrite reductase/ring-hydroxylating ferredoxin subunit